MPRRDRQRGAHERRPGSGASTVRLPPYAAARARAAVSASSAPSPASSLPDTWSSTVSER